MAETLNEGSAPGPGPAARRPVRAFLALLAAVFGLVLLLRFLPAAEWVSSFQSWVAARGAAGAAAFFLVYVLASLVPGGPAALLTLAGGAVFGFGKGLALVSAASTTSAGLAFLLARGALRPRAERLMSQSPRLSSLSRAVEREGPRIVVLVRLSPLFPFTVVNWAFGAMPLRFGPYLLASWLAMLPGTAAYVWFGAALGTAASAGAESPAAKAVRIALGVLAVVATALVARLAARAVRRAGVE